MTQSDDTRSLKDYRLYLISADGHIMKALHLNSADDDAAIAMADELANDAAAELWYRGRFVAQWKLPN
jgi:hypothetical protein